MGALQLLGSGNTLAPTCNISKRRLGICSLFSLAIVIEVVYVKHVNIVGSVIGHRV
jgi:hypothetical protein